MSSVETTHYCLGSVVGPHPLPADRARFPVDHRPRDAAPSASSSSAGCPTWSWPAWAEAATPPACSIRSSPTRAWHWWASRRAGDPTKPGDHAATLCFGRPGVLHGSFSYVLQDDDGQTSDVHSVSAGLDYPGTGPEHSYWKETGRVAYTSARDDEALEAFDMLRAAGGHSAGLGKFARGGRGDEACPAAKSRTRSIVVCLSGRGDKDAAEIARLRGVEF